MSTLFQTFGHRRSGPGRPSAYGIFRNNDFKKILEIGWKNPFYRRRWTAAGLQPGDVQGLDQITRLPTYNSDDVKQDQIERPPFGDFHGLSDADRRRTPLKVQTSGGTTGTPRPTVFGPVEWELNGLSCARVMFEQGARPGDVCQFLCHLRSRTWVGVSTRGVTTIWACCPLQREAAS